VRKSEAKNNSGLWQSSFLLITNKRKLSCAHKTMSSGKTVFKNADVSPANNHITMLMVFDSLRNRLAAISNCCRLSAISQFTSRHAIGQQVLQRKVFEIHSSPSGPALAQNTSENLSNPSTRCSIAQFRAINLN
jgi:hypothetical protein